MQAKGESVDGNGLPASLDLYNYIWKSSAVGIDRAGLLLSIQFYAFIQT